MRYDELLEEQKEELMGAYEVAVLNGDVEDNMSFAEWAEIFDFGDDDFFCTATRNRSYDLMLSGNDVLTLYEDEIRALEQFVGKCIGDGKELLESLSRLIQREVETYAA